MDEPVAERAEEVQWQYLGHGYYDVALAVPGALGDAVRAEATVLSPTYLDGGAPLLASDGTPIRGTCGVAFVSPSYAITASHCVDDVDGPHMLEVQTGETFTRGASYRFSVRVVPPPGGSGSLTVRLGEQVIVERAEPSFAAEERAGLVSTSFVPEAGGTQDLSIEVDRVSEGALDLTEIVVVRDGTVNAFDRFDMRLGTGLIPSADPERACLGALPPAVGAGPLHAA